MATDKDPTFQDILLELMVSNETLDKIEKNTASLVPFLTSVSQAQSPANNELLKPGESKSDVYSCCESILVGVNSMVAGLGYLASYAEEGNKLLVQIRNSLMGMREDAALDRLKKLETDREASNATGTTARTTQVRAGRSMPEIPGTNLGTIAKIGLTPIAALRGIPAFFGSFLRTFTTQVLKSFNPKRMAMEFGKLAVNLSKSIGKRLTPYLTRVGEVFERLASKSKALYRLKLAKPIDGLVQAFERLSSQAKALYRLKISKNFPKADSVARELATGLRKTFRIFSKEYLKATWANLKSVVKNPIDAELAKGIRKTYQMMTEPIVKFFERLASKTRALKRLILNRSGLTKYLEEFRLAWREVTMTFRGIARTFRSVSKGAGYIARLAKTFEEAISFTARMAGRFIKFGSALGKMFGLLGRILPGIDLIIAGYEFITTWNNTAGDAIKKLEAAGDAALDSLIGWTYDLPKSVVGWIVGKFDKDLGKAISETSFKDTIIPGLKAMWESIIEAMLSILPKSISSWLRGVDTKAGVEMNTDRKVKEKDPVVLENGARTLADANVPLGTKQQTLQLLTQKYGFTKQEVGEAVRAKLGKPLEDQVQLPVGETPKVTTSAAATPIPPAPTALPQSPSEMEMWSGKLPKFLELPPLELPTLEPRISAPKFLELPPLEPRIVNLQENLDTANISGAKMSAYQSETEDLRAQASLAPVFVPPPAVAPPVVNSSNVNSVIYNNTNIPDRTQINLTPAFAY